MDRGELFFSIALAVAAQAYTLNKARAEHNQQDEDEQYEDACERDGEQESNRQTRELATMATCVLAGSVAARARRRTQETRQAGTGMGRRAECT